MTVIQRFLFPSMELRPETDLYLKTERGGVYSNVIGEVRLQPGGIVHFDTYFNGFSVGKWRRHTHVRHVNFTVEGVGCFEVHVVLNHPHRSARVIAAELFDVTERTELSIAPIDLDQLGDGQLYLKIQCLERGATIFGATVGTADHAPQDVRLGIVITTYNRAEYVRDNIDRLARALKRVPGYEDRIQVVVVDNAGTLDLSLPANVPISVLRNPNLGGAGGFARGLMAFRDAGEVSHVLFMDDDISFEPEVIFRTYDFLSFATDPLLCVAGAMLMEEQPHVQFESGAVFKTESVHPFRPIGSLLDLREWRNVVTNDMARPAGYGGWWFFAFPLALATVNPLPVFVRGDDVLFGLKHAGEHTVTLSGVGVWHQDFSRKNGPTAFFYEARNLPLVSLLASDRYGARHLVYRFVYHTVRMLLTLKYDTAAAYIRGMRAFLEGPEAWMRVDHAALNAEVRTDAGEQLMELGPDGLAIPAYKPKLWLTPRLGGLLSSLLLSGHVFPKFVNRRAPVALKVQAWSPVSVLWRETVLYRYDATGEGFAARRNRRRFFGLFAEMVSTVLPVPMRFGRLKQAYRAAYPEMTSDSYWRRQFAKSLDETTPAPEA